MLIEKIHISDWRNIEETSADLAPLTIVKGANHNGKSSVAQAIQIPLTTRSEGTDAQGRGANDKIRIGAKKAKIDLQIRGKAGSTAFSVTYGPNRTGRQAVCESPAFLKWLETNTERLSCCLDSEYFIRQKAEDQKSILAGLVLPQSFEFPEEMRKLVAEAMPQFDWNAFDWKGKPVTVIDFVYEHAFEARKLAKAQAAANHIPQLPAQRPTSKSVEEIKGLLKGVRDKLTEALKDRPQIDTAELQRLIDEQTEVGGRLFRLEAEAEETRTAMRDADSNILAPAQLKVYERIASHRKQYDNLQSQIDVIVQQIEDQRSVQAIWRDMEETCPTCQQKITKEFIAARIAEAQTLIDNKGVKQNELMRDQRELGDIEQAERLVQAHTDAIGQKATLQRQLADEVSNISNLKDRQRDLKAKIEAAKGGVEDSKKPNPEVDHLRSEIARGESVLEAAIRYEALVAQISEASERARQLTAKVEALEKLCKYFGKDGIKATLIQQNIEEFESSVNAVLQVWGYQAKLSIEPYSFEVTTHKGTLPLKELSGSEKLMFAVALQTAIASHSKIGVVVIDKADTFINGERNRLFGALASLLRSSVIEQAVVMVADEKTDVPQKEGVVYYAAQAGKLVRL